jgi:5-methylcytosine-specific restriction endonuclease McrA
MKSDYNSVKWIQVRDRVKKRDKYRCTKCKLKKSNLHVHHTIYIKGNRIWEIPDRYLRTLCAECHEKEHENRKITTFVKEPNRKNFTKKELKKINEIKKKKKPTNIKPHIPNLYNTSWYDLI